MFACQARVILGAVVEWIEAASLTDLLAGKRTVLEHGDHEVLVLALAGRVYAVSNICTHDEVWLDDGTLHPESCEIECPMHEGRFDLRTGAATHEPCEVAIARFDVRVDGDRVLVSIPD